MNLEFHNTISIINLLSFAIIFLLLVPHLRDMWKKYKKGLKGDIDRPVKNKISANVPTDLYTMVVQAAKLRNCTITAYVIQSLKERLQREEALDVHTS